MGLILDKIDAKPELRDQLSIRRFISIILKPFMKKVSNKTTKIKRGGSCILL